MRPPPRPVKPQKTFSRVRYLHHRHPDNLKGLVQSGNNMFNNNAEVVNFGPYNEYNARANVERSRANIRAGMVTPPTKGTRAMNVFGAYGELPSESGHLKKAPGAPIKKAPLGNSRRRRAVSRRARKTRRN